MARRRLKPAFRFYILYDKICREDILRHAYALARANAGAPGVDGTTFDQIDASGVEAWLAGLREELVSKTYRADPVRRATIPKPGGGQRPLGIPTISGSGGSDRRQPPGLRPIGANISGPWIGTFVFFAEARADDGTELASGLVGKRLSARA